MAQGNRSKEVWLIPKRGSLHQTICLIDGIKAGEFKKIDVKAANDLFYSLLESAVFRLSILDQNDLSEFDRTIELAVANISV